MSHNQRRIDILKKHGSITAFYKNDVFLCIPMITVGVIHSLFAIYSKYLSFTMYIFISYIFGSICSQNLFLANHELSHNHVFKKPIHNKILSLFLNIPIGIPYTSFFQKYHNDHHNHLGVYMTDMDLPSSLEINLIQNNTFFKFFWVAFQIVAYALRPLLLKPKSWTNYDYINFTFILTTNFLFIYTFSCKSFFYFLLSAFFGGGLHPIAGHFISEHYNLHNSSDQDTFSYYGILNIFTYNVGYHNEHHDFPQIPGSKLPFVTQIAPEYYTHLHSHSSWYFVLWNYITKRNLGPMCRKYNTH